MGKSYGFQVSPLIFSSMKVLIDNGYFNDEQIKPQSKSRRCYTKHNDTKKIGELNLKTTTNKLIPAIVFL